MLGMKSLGGDAGTRSLRVILAVMPPVALVEPRDDGHNLRGAPHRPVSANASFHSFHWRDRSALKALLSTVSACQPLCVTLKRIVA